MTTDVEDELEFIAAQLNESFRDTNTECVLDAICDIAYSRDLADDDEDYSIEFDVVLDGICYLAATDFISDTESSRISFRHFEVSSAMSPPSITLSHKHSPRAYTLSAINANEPTVEIKVNTGRYELTQTKTVDMEG